MIFWGPHSGPAAEGRGSVLASGETHFGEILWTRVRAKRTKWIFELLGPLWPAGHHGVVTFGHACAAGGQRRVALGAYGDSTRLRADWRLAAADREGFAQSRRGTGVNC